MQIFLFTISKNRLYIWQPKVRFVQNGCTAKKFSYPYQTLADKLRHLFSFTTLSTELPSSFDYCYNAFVEQLFACPCRPSGAKAVIWRLGETMYYYWWFFKHIFVPQSFCWNINTTYAVTLNALHHLCRRAANVSNGKLPSKKNSTPNFSSWLFNTSPMSVNICLWNE